MPTKTTRKRPAKRRAVATQRTTSFKLAAEDAAFIRAQLRSGAAQNASQIVRAAMREYRETNELRLMLRATLEARLKGPVDSRSVDEIFDEIEHEVFGAAQD
jgi:putative addiction module CopG family antidote